MPNTQILVVEDEEICIGFIEHTLAEKGYEIAVAKDCAEAWRLLENESSQFEAILLDRGLPDIDGLFFLKKLKADPALRDIPVIMETASSDNASIREGFAAGAYYYLTKPLNADLLASIVTTAVDQQRNDRALQAAVKQNGRTFLPHLDQAVFHFRTLDAAKSLAQALSQTCAEPDRVVVGLQELLINAVEHGNLAISYTDKTRLVIENRWLEEVEIRQTLPEFENKQVEVRFRRNVENIVIIIQDDGPGFDWQKYLDLDPERAFDPHGRGIALAKMMSFDGLNYLGNGNTVEVTINNIWNNIAC